MRGISVTLEFLPFLILGRNMAAFPGRLRRVYWREERPASTMVTATMTTTNMNTWQQDMLGMYIYMYSQLSNVPHLFLIMIIIICPNDSSTSELPCNNQTN